MSFRSRLSAAWKAFKRDDFPQTSFVHTITVPIKDSEPFCIHPIEPNGWRGKWYSGPSRVCPTHGTNPPVRLDLKATTYNVHPPVDMSPHPLPSIVDETDAIHAEEQRELSKLTPDYSNLEVPTVLRKRKKKLESVKK